MQYRFGNQVVTNLGAELVVSRRVAVSLQAVGRFTAWDRFRGQDVPSTGETFLDVSPGVSLRSGQGTTVYAHVELPVYERVNETNLAPRWGLLLGISGRL